MGYAEQKIKDTNKTDNSTKDEFIYMKTFPVQSILEVKEIGEGVTIGKCKPFWAARREDKCIFFSAGVAIYNSYYQGFESLEFARSCFFSRADPFYDEGFGSAWIRARPGHVDPTGCGRTWAGDPAEKWLFSTKEDSLNAVLELKHYAPHKDAFTCELYTYNSDPYPAGVIFPSNDYLQTLRHLLNSGSQKIDSKAKEFASPERKKVTPKVRRQVLERDGFKCVDCGRSPQKDSSCVLHVDHRLAIANGGTSIMSNLQTLCDWCNLGKRTDLDWKLK